MRVSTLLSVIAAIVLSGSAHAEEGDDSLQDYGVQIVRTPKQPGTGGSGIYLGNGVVLTAAHVAGLGFWRKPRVEVEGRDLPTKVLKDGHFHNVDLTLLSVDMEDVPPSLAARHMTVCGHAPWTGEEVIVANRDESGRSYVMSPDLLPPGLPPKAHTVIYFHPETSASGSGIFDANEKCLLGLISGKIWRNEQKSENGQTMSEHHDLASYFVPAPVIAGFIPSEVHF
jgi:hypothetical protein